MGTIRITLRAMTTGDSLAPPGTPGAVPRLCDLVPATRNAPSAWTSEQLFAGRTEIEIVHGTAVYRLRQTSLGKLILTK